MQTLLYSGVNECMSASETATAPGRWMMMTTDAETSENRWVATEAPLSPSSIQKFLDLLDYIDSQVDSTQGHGGSLPRTLHGIVASAIAPTTRTVGHGLPARLLKQWSQPLRSSLNPQDVPAVMVYARSCRVWSYRLTVIEPLDKEFDSTLMLALLRERVDAVQPDDLTERGARQAGAERLGRRSPAEGSAALIERRRRAFLLGQSDLNALEAILTRPRRGRPVTDRCPHCGGRLMTRRAQRGINAGRDFSHCGAAGCDYTRTA